MNWGMKTWNGSGLVVLDMNSASFAILAAGMELLPTSGSRFIPLAVNTLDADKELVWANDWFVSGVIYGVEQSSTGFTITTFSHPGGTHYMNYWVLYR